MANMFRLFYSEYHLDALLRELGSQNRSNSAELCPVVKLRY